MSLEPILTNPLNPQEPLLAGYEPDPEPDPEWEFPSPPTDLPYDDGEPLESNRHRIAMNVLIDSTLQALSHRTDYFAGGNMFVYYSQDQAMNRDFRGPDYFVALEVDGDRERRSWITWEEQGRYPDAIVEFMSPSTANIDLNEKKHLYERTFRTADYFVYNPFDPTSLQGWHLDASQQYQPLIPNSQGWLWSEKLGLWLGNWEGSIRREPPTGGCSWLRLYDSEGNLVLLAEEVAHVAQQRADEERQRADEERQRADEERQRADEERQRADRFATRLRELGIDPDQV
jgi:Uma2 family endonuclease